MSDSGVWGITQEYFDKVYPKQRKNFPVPVLVDATAKAVSEARESTIGAESCEAHGNSRGGETLYASTLDEAREWDINDYDA